MTNMRDTTKRYHDLLEILERGKSVTVELPTIALRRFEKGLSNARQTREPTIPKKYLSFVRELSATGGKVTLTIRLTGKKKP